MKIYFCTGYSHKQQLRALSFDANQKILLSYFYSKNEDLFQMLKDFFPQGRPAILLDSGAFTAASQGKTIDRYAYQNYIVKYHDILANYANLDVIGNADASYYNLRLMEKDGFHPLPVFHVGEDWKFLERYINEYKYIALGGMVPYLRFPKRLMAWINRAFVLAQGKAVFHGFGCTSWPLLKMFPWYSVDSSSWVAGSKFGHVPLFNKRLGKFQDIHVGDRKICYQYAPLFRDHGLDPKQFSKREEVQRYQVYLAAARAFRLAEKWVEQRHGPIALPERSSV